jgi:DNA-directed RNA polymerase subunit H
VIQSLNVLEHELVPKHEVLSKEEQEEVLKKFSATADELPKIRSSDSVLKYIEAKSGDVIRITRKSPTAGETIYYRIVV